MFRPSYSGYSLTTVLMIAVALVAGGVRTRDAWAQDETSPRKSEVRFDLEALSKVPEIYPAEGLEVDGVKSLFFEGPAYKGRATRVFAYYGVPQPAVGAEKPAKSFPAMVLIHGGGGTAFDRWVKLWNSRGYAAIAMDVCGCVPVGTYGKWQRHEQGGPPGWDASFGQLEDPIEDQWTWHAVSDVALAHSLIRSFPEVDPDRIGVTGISWGGYLTCIVAGVDHRFQFASPVYGCGYLGDNSAWLPSFEKLGKEKTDLWLKQWDPSAYLGQVQMPMLWVNGTNDFAYPMDSWKKSCHLPQSPRTLCLRIRMPHGHGAAGENPEEIRVFADSILKEGKPLAKVIEQGESDGTAWARNEAAVPLVKAELCFTRDSGKWQDRKWETLPAEIDASSSKVSASVPGDATVFYLNLFDDRECVVSTEHIDHTPKVNQND
ncbi:MAG TPA: acetylxylan esterase [Planctomycetaceae bacterium]|nr:acetylxylan esterase [Planctomycetaceae bacterium]